jgi:hypothetical protein
MFAILVLALAQDAQINWLTSYDEGYAVAQKERKLMLVHWTSDH